WFHVSGITPALGEAPVAALAAAIDCARARGIPVSLDLNYREALWHDRNPQPLIEPLARQVGVLIGNPAAVSAMLGVPADAECGGTASAWRLTVPGGSSRVSVGEVEELRRA